MIIIDFIEKGKGKFEFQHFQHFSIASWVRFLLRKQLPKTSLLFPPPFKLLTAVVFQSFGRHYPRQVPLPRTRIPACPLTKQSSILHPNYFQFILDIFSVMDIFGPIIDSCHFLVLIKNNRENEKKETIRNHRKLIAWSIYWKSNRTILTTEGRKEKNFSIKLRVRRKIPRSRKNSFERETSPVEENVRINNNGG